MFKTIKSMFGMESYQKVLYPLQDCSLESIDVRFENISRVLTKKGHTTITDYTFSKVMDTYETRHNEPHILTMIVHSPECRIFRRKMYVQNQIMIQQ